MTVVLTVVPQKRASLLLVLTVICSTPDRNRTCNLRIRSALLYPVELRGRQWAARRFAAIEVGRHGIDAMETRKSACMFVRRETDAM